jgi:MFS family permease
LSPRHVSALWRHGTFLTFWMGQTVSAFGAQVTVLALPLTAALSNLLVDWASRRLGFGRAVVWAAVVGSAGGVLYALAGGPVPLAVAVLVAAEFFMGFGGGLYSIATRSLQQIVTPDPLLGRMNASMSFLSSGPEPLGALAGGFLGAAIGLRPTLAVGAVGGVVGFLWVWFSPLRALREQLHGECHRW